METRKHALYWGYIVPIACKNFSARISLRGRIFIEEEGDQKFYVYGINPGGIYAFGTSEKAAIDAFTSGFSIVVKDHADVAVSFEEFKSEIEELFNNNINLVIEKEWNAAIPNMQVNAECRETYIRVEQIEADPMSAHLSLTN